MINKKVTLAGTPCIENLKGVARCAFTLAEVLIVIGVIGVVAGLTIPSLINTISEKAKTAQTDVIEARLLDGLNRYSAMEDGLSKHYENTYEFLQGLSKYYKMTQICKADEITKCVPYPKMFYETEKDGGKSAKSVDVASLTSTTKLMPPAVAENYLPPASFISAQGTPVIIALKKGCIRDTGKAMISIEDSECVSLMYDKNGTGLPNKFGDDVVGLGLSPEVQPLKVINGIKVMEKAFFPQTGLTKAECEAEIPKEAEYKKLGFETGITECSNSNDYWAYAMKYCKEKGFHLPNEEESLKLVQGLYYKENKNNHPISDSRFLDYTYDTELASIIGLSDDFIALWINKEIDINGAAYARLLNPLAYATSITKGSKNTEAYVICIGD